jgi:hypothetical protein
VVFVKKKAVISFILTIILIILPIILIRVEIISGPVNNSSYEESFNEDEVYEETMIQGE